MKPQGCDSAPRRTSGYLTACLMVYAVLFLFAWNLATPFQSVSFAQDTLAFQDLGLVGGQILDLAIDPTQPDKIFAGTELGDGLYVTYNGGETWVAVTTRASNQGEDEFINQSVFDIAIAARDPKVVWVAHDQWLEKSSDGGLTWTHISNDRIQRHCTNCGGETDDQRLCHVVKIHPADPNIVYVGTSGPDETYANGAIYETTDGGITWTKLRQGANFDYAIWDMDISPVNPEIIYAATNSAAYKNADGDLEYKGNFFRSIDGGNSWTKLPVFDNYPYPCNAIAVKPDNPNIVFGANSSSLVKYKISGDTITSTNIMSKINEKSGWFSLTLVQDIAFSPENPNIVYAVGGKREKLFIARSLDGGKTWTHYFTEEKNFISVELSSSGKRVYTGDRGKGVFRSLDEGGAFTPISNGIKAVIVYDVKVNPRNSRHLLAATVTGIYERKSGGSWSLLREGETRSVFFHPQKNDIYFAGQEGSFLKSIDGGHAWAETKILSGPGSGDSHNYVEDIYVDSEDDNRIYICVNRFDNTGVIQGSVDGGVSFSKVLNSENTNKEPYPFNSIAIDPNNSQHILAGGGSFFAPFVSGDLWATFDGGKTWSRTALTDKIVNVILFDPVHEGVVYVGTGNYRITDIPLYKSVDGGITWFDSSDGLPAGADTGDNEHTAGNAVTGLALNRNDKNIVYISTWRKGIYAAFQGRDAQYLGTPLYGVHSIAAGSLYSATQGGLTQLTGTGCIYGNVTDAASREGIDGAWVLTDGGLTGRTVKGQYLLVAPAGQFNVAARADGYADTARESLVVVGGDAVAVDFSMSALPHQAAPLSAPTIITPIDRASIIGSSVTFKWTIPADENRRFKQYLYCSKNPDLTGSQPIATIDYEPGQMEFAGPAASLLVLAIPMFARMRRKETAILCALIMAVTGGFALTSCTSSTEDPANAEVILEQSVRQAAVISYKITALDPGSTYYWKVVFDDGKGGHSESPVLQFATSSSKSQWSG